MAEAQADPTDLAFDAATQQRARTEHVMSKPATIKAAITVAVIGIAAFLISGIPRFKNAKHGGDYVAGEIAWVAFLVCLLAFVVIGVVAAVRVARQRRSHA